MNWKIEQITAIPSVHNGRFDLHPQHGLACLVNGVKTQALYLNGHPCRTWSTEEFPDVWGVRWFSQAQVCLWLVNRNAVLASGTTWTPFSAGRLWDILCANDYIFVTYDDESVTRARPGEIEHNVLAVFSGDRIFRVGLVDLLLANRDNSSPIEINAAYTFNNTIMFVPYPGESVYILDADKKSLTKRDVSFNTVNTVAFSGNDKQAFAIVEYAEQFELVHVDLASGQSQKGDFRALAKELDEAGFKSGAWHFRSSLGGRMIVSDDRQAAFIELF
jgi:hypothetical protein